MTFNEYKMKNTNNDTFNIDGNDGISTEDAVTESKERTIEEIMEELGISEEDIEDTEEVGGDGVDLITHFNRSGKTVVAYPDGTRYTVNEYTGELEPIADGEDFGYLECEYHDDEDANYYRDSIGCEICAGYCIFYGGELKRVHKSEDGKKLMVDKTRTDDIESGAKERFSDGMMDIYGLNGIVLCVNSCKVVSDHIFAIEIADGRVFAYNKADDKYIFLGY